MREVWALCIIVAAFAAGFALYWVLQILSKKPTGGETLDAIMNMQAIASMPETSFAVVVTDLSEEAISGAIVSFANRNVRTDAVGVAVFDETAVDVTSDAQLSIMVTAENDSSDPPMYQTFVDQIVPSAVTNRVFVVRMEGWSLLESPWLQVYNAVHRLDEGPQTVRLTYSFMPSGIYVGDGGQSIVVKEHWNEDATLDEATFKSEVRRSLTFWSELMNRAFSVAEGYANDLTVIFEETHETAPVHTMSSYVVGDHGTGDFRIGMYFQGSSDAVLAYAYGPDTSGSMNWAGDMFFNAHVDWRLDDDVEDGNGDGGFSIYYTAVHEFGHALGIGHNASMGSIMYPMAGETYSIHNVVERNPGYIHELKALQGIYA